MNCQGKTEELFVYIHNVVIFVKSKKMSTRFKGKMLRKEGRLTKGISRSTLDKLDRVAKALGNSSKSSPLSNKLVNNFSLLIVSEMTSPATLFKSKYVKVLRFPMSHHPHFKLLRHIRLLKAKLGTIRSICILEMQVSLFFDQCIV